MAGCWTTWDGGECPVPLGATVEYVCFDPEVYGTSLAEGLRWNWNYDGNGTDIKAYRLMSVTQGTDKPSNPKDMVGVKKVPFSVISAAVMAEVGVGMLEGASKYGRHNYRAVGVRASVYYDATMRHLTAWWEGEDIDRDSGLSHVTKAICSLTVLRDAMINDMWEDDRAPSCPEFYTELNKKVDEILERYKDRAPRHYTIADTRKAENV
jgi:hypothetical protein